MDQVPLRIFGDITAEPPAPTAVSLSNVKRSVCGEIEAVGASAGRLTLALRDSRLHIGNAA